jgi:hypothetical protein
MTQGTGTALVEIGVTMRGCDLRLAGASQTGTHERRNVRPAPCTHSRGVVGVLAAVAHSEARRDGRGRGPVPTPPASRARLVSLAIAHIEWSRSRSLFPVGNPCR